MANPQPIPSHCWLADVFVKVAVSDAASSTSLDTCLLRAFSWASKAAFRYLYRTYSPRHERAAPKCAGERRESHFGLTRMQPASSNQTPRPLTPGSWNPQLSACVRAVNMAPILVMLFGCAGCAGFGAVGSLIASLGGVGALKVCWIGFLFALEEASLIDLECGSCLGAGGWGGCGGLWTCWQRPGVLLTCWV